MTVKELRNLLYEIENQDAEICLVTSEKYGVITSTKTVEVVGRSDDPEGYVTIN